MNASGRTTAVLVLVLFLATIARQGGLVAEGAVLSAVLVVLLAEVTDARRR